MIPSSMIAGQASLASANETFLEFVRRHPECLDGSQFEALREPHAWIEYPMQSWPIFVRADKAEELRRASAILARLICSLPDRLFGHDPDQMVQHLGLDPKDARFLVGMLEDPNLNRGLITRSDFVFGTEGFRCLEVNMSNPGGLGNSNIAEVYRDIPLVSHFFEESGLSAYHEDNIEALLSFLFEESKELAESGELNFAVVLEDPPPGGYLDCDSLKPWVDNKEARSGLFDQRWQRLLHDRDPSLKGAATMCFAGELSEKGECVYLHGRRQHVVIEYVEGRTAPALFIPWMAGNLRLLNGPLSSLFSDKRLLAWLSELEGSDLFSAEERQVIQDFVPWTRRLRKGAKTRFGGRRQTVAEIVEQQREQMVLKSAHGSSGLSVHLGKETSEEAWRELLRQALDDGRWIAQEMIDPVPLIFQEGDSGWAPHQVVWGVFAFGDRPGGSFLRIQPSSKSGVVSTELGAQEGLFFEVEET